MPGPIIIIGDNPLIEEVESNIAYVAPFRQERAEEIIALYNKDESKITAEMQVFILLCGIDIVQNADS